MNKEQLIEKWQEEFVFCEEQERNNLKNKEYIVAHNHVVRKEQIRLFINDIKKLDLSNVINQVCEHNWQSKLDLRGNTKMCSMCGWVQ